MRFAVLLTTFLTTAPAFFAQTTFATLTGTVTDPKGLPVPSVSIEVRNDATGYVYTGQSNLTGVYTVGQLVPGPYSMHARHEGFKEYVGSRIDLLARDIKTVDIALEVGSVTTTVEVAGAAPLIETETARLSQITTSRQLNTVPVLQRRMQEFMPILPTVTVQGGVMHFAGSAYNNQNYWSMDGVQISSFQSGNQPGTVLNFVESVSELQVNAGSATADQPGLSNITVISKSGTNDIHGSAYDYYSSSNWSARNPFAAGGTGSITHNPGGSLGGPVYIPKLYNGKNRTFFFQTYETTLTGMPRAAMNSTVPPVPWRSGNFGALAVKDPTTGLNFPGNTIPASRLNPVSLKIQDKFYPLPNTGDPNAAAAQNLKLVLTRPAAAVYMETSRIDHRLTEKHYLNGRLSYSYSGGINQDGNLPTIGLWYRTLSNWNSNITESWNIRPNLVNEFRWGMVKEDGPQFGSNSGLESVTGLGLQGLAPNLPDYPGLFGVSFSGLTMSGVSQTVFHDPFSQNFTNQFHENLSWFRGRHGLKFGVSFTRGEFDDRPASNNLYGNAAFSNRFTGQPYADFLLGYPSTVSRSYPRDTTTRVRKAWDFFVSDSWKITPSLTFDLGVRYEYHPYAPEIHGEMSMFDPGDGKIVVPDAGMKLVSPLFPSSYAAVVSASSVGLNSATLLNSDRNNLAPRLGVAWRPSGNKTVIRAGFGIYYDVTPVQVQAAGVPFVIDEPSYTVPVNNPIILPQVFPNTTIGGPATISLPKAIRGDLRIPYSLQTTVSIDREQWGNAFSLAFLGTGLREGFYDTNLNQPVADTRPFINKPRAFLNYPAIRYTSNGAGHQYNGLVAKVERRFHGGLSYIYSFTWSRDIGDLGSAYLQDLPHLLENSYDRQRDKSSMYDVPIRRHTGTLIWDLPVGRKRKFYSGAPKVLDAIIGGWQLASVLTTHSGQLMTPLWTGPDPTGTALTTSLTPAIVTIRPDRIADGNLPTDVRSIKKWYDVSAFKAPQPGQFGTSGAGILLGPPSFVLRGALNKYFTLHERLKMNMAVQASNILNHPNYSPPGLDITTPGTAGIINAIGDSTDTDQSGRRGIRIMLRIEW